MDRAIPSNSHIGKSRRLDAMVSPGLHSAQQQEKHNHRAITQSNPLRIRTPINPWHIRTLKQQDGRRTCQENDGKQGSSHQGHQQSGKRKRNHPKPVPHWESSLARREKLEISPSSHQTQSEMLWTLQDHQRDFPSGVSTPIATIMEHPPRVSCVSLITL